METQETKQWRLDRLISTASNRSRKQVQSLIKSGAVLVNGQPVLKSDGKVTLRDEIKIGTELLVYKKYLYIMLNKPKDVVCATKDNLSDVVLELLPTEFRRKGLFPAGRLDKDTEGFVLITDDGQFAHNMLSPKKQIAKTYIAEVDGMITPSVLVGFQTGVQLKEQRCLPAEIQILDEAAHCARVVIRQGMYHQIKRMFSAFGLTVTALKRVKIGNLELDNRLKLGECREITEAERLKIFTK